MNFFTKPLTAKDLTGMVVASALVFPAVAWFSYRDAPKPTDPPGLAPAASAVWPASVPELIERYNTAALRVNRNLLLPPASALHKTVKQPNLQVLSHEVAPSTSVAIELRQPSGKPRSLAVMAQPKTEAEAMQAMAVVAVMASAIRGLPEDGQRLVKQCLLEKSADEIKVGGSVFQCTALPGLIAASVWPDDEP